MAEITLEFIAKQLERVLAEQAALREGLEALRAHIGCIEAEIQVLEASIKVLTLEVRRFNS
jgi:prefoldin subunit 5